VVARRLGDPDFFTGRSEGQKASIFGRRAVAVIALRFDALERDARFEELERGA